LLSPELLSNYTPIFPVWSQQTCKPNWKPQSPNFRVPAQEYQQRRKRKPQTQNQEPETGSPRVPQPQYRLTTSPLSEARKLLMSKSRQRMRQLKQRVLMEG